MQFPGKFRVWTGSRMSSWDDYMLTADGDLYKREEYEVGTALETQTVSCPDSEVMFYTGLTDVEGNPVYEKDVVEIKKGPPGVVEYQPASGGWVLHRPDGKIALFEDWFTEEFGGEVVGNTCQNPSPLQ